MNKSSKKRSVAQTKYPSPIKKRPNSLSNDKKIEFIQKRFEEILDCLGLDLTNDSLKETPERVARMYVEEFFSGLSEENFPDVSFFKEDLSQKGMSHMVSAKMSFVSHCEHHFVPMFGTVYISYLPTKKVIGLSKLPRIVRYFAARPQLQERLTAQIADCLSTLLETEDIAVAVTARHLCVIARGVQDECSEAITHHLQGRFLQEESIKRDFFATLSSFHN